MNWGLKKGREKAIREEVYLQLNGNDLINWGTLFPDVTLGAYL